MRFSKTTVGRATTNKAGGKAYKAENPEQELVFAVLTTFLEDKYYETGDERMQRIVSLIKQVPHEFTAKLAVLARTEFNMRSVTVVLLGELAKLHRDDDLVKRAIVKSATRVDDLIELVAYFKAQKLALPKQVKRGVRNAILKFDRYQLAKYQAKSRDVSLVDVFNLTHPKVSLANADQKAAWEDLMKGNLKVEGTVETTLSNSGEETPEAFAKLITSGKIGYMALLRNLNNVIKYKLSAEVIDQIATRLADKAQVKKSKQLPFRFLTAFENVQGSRKLTDAITDALEASVDNVPVFSGKSLVALDCSGSMGGRPAQIGSIFAAALAKSNPNADVVVYDTHVQEPRFSTRDSLMSIANGIRFNGGGTDTAQVFRYAMGKGYDRIFIVSDNESWVSPAQTAYNRMDPKPKVYAIDVAGNGTFDVVGDKVLHFGTWSEKVFDLIKLSEDKVGIVAKVNSVEL